MMQCVAFKNCNRDHLQPTALNKSSVYYICTTLLQATLKTDYIACSTYCIQWIVYTRQAQIYNLSYSLQWPKLICTSELQTIGLLQTQELFSFLLKIGISYSLLHSIFIRTVRFGTFTSILAGFGQKFSLHCIACCSAQNAHNSVYTMQLIKWFPIEKQTPGTKTLLSYDIYIGPIRTFSENPVG